MRIRSIKPEYWASRTLSRVSWDARHVLKGLESYVDDNGAGKYDLAIIVAALFPHDLVADPQETMQRVAAAIDELRREGLIWLYRAEDVTRGREVDALFISCWEQVQRVDRPNKGRIRRPDGTLDYGESLIREDCTNPREDCRNPREDCRNPRDCNRGTGEQGNSISMRTFGDPKDAPQVEHTDNAPESITEQPALVDAPVADDSGSRDSASGDPVGQPDPDQPSRHEQPAAPQPDTPPAQPTGSRYSAEFETWWDGYPVKRGKAKAYKAFRKARRRASLETLTEGRDRYAAWLAAHPDRSPKWAEGWLNGDRWEDDLSSGDPTNSGGGGGGVIDMWRAAADRLAASDSGGRDSPPPQLDGPLALIIGQTGAP